MEQLSFKFDENKVSENQLLQEAKKLTIEYDELLRKIIIISVNDALNMTVRGDFYDTEFEGSLIHSKLQRIASMLNWKYEANNSSR